MKSSRLGDLLLSEIPEHPAHTTAPELLHKLERNGRERPPALRTIQRSLERLAEAHPDLICDESKPHRWYWRAGTRNRALRRMDPSTALAFGLLEKHLASLIPEPFRDELDRMFRKAEGFTESIPDARLDRWKARTALGSALLQLPPASVNPEVLRTVQEALLDRVQLDLVYRSAREGEALELCLHPQGIVLADGVFYLIATDDGERNPAYYAVHRIESAHASTRRSKDIPGFDASRFVDDQQGLQFKTGRTIRLKLRIRWFLPLHLSERPLAPDQVIRPIDEEWCQLSATVIESDQLEWWLSSFGAQCEVLAPARLRKRMQEQAREVSRLYRAKAASSSEKISRTKAKT